MKKPLRLITDNNEELILNVNLPILLLRRQDKYYLIIPGVYKDWLINKKMYDTIYTWLSSSTKEDIEHIYKGE